MRKVAKIVWRRNVVSHTECGPKCDIDRADPKCTGTVIEQVTVIEKEDGFHGYIGDIRKTNEMSHSHSQEKAIEQLCEWLCDQGWWVGGTSVFIKGDRIKVKFEAPRNDGKQATALAIAVVTKISRFIVYYKIVDLVEAHNLLRPWTEGGFSHTMNHDDIEWSDI